jgi:ABC-type phosphate/phosphonate transport system substrate-binding protein
MKTLTSLAALLLLLPLAGPAYADEPRAAAVRVGAVASGPESVTLWRDVKAHLGKNGFPIDYVLYSNYDALVEALKAGHVQIAWNTPLAHARYHVQSGGKSQTLVMRDVDRDFRAVVVARADAGVSRPADLSGKTLILGSKDSAEATVLPLHYLHKQGVKLGEVKVLSLHEELDNEGCPCSSERDVLAALLKGRGHAGVISQGLWKRLEARSPEQAGKLRVVWTSPAFSHCVFTAAADFDAGLGRRFRELMVAMDGKDARTAAILRAEGCKAWVPGSQDGFADLFEAVRREESSARKQ